MRICTNRPSIISMESLGETNKGRRWASQLLVNKRRTKEVKRMPGSKKIMCCSKRSCFIGLILLSLKGLKK